MQARPLYLEYAKLEERYGLARHAMEVYDRAVRGVPAGERLGVLDIYIARATEFFGIAKVRGHIRKLQGVKGKGTLTVLCVCVILPAVTDVWLLVCCRLAPV